MTWISNTLDFARKRLVTVAQTDSVAQAARLLSNRATSLVVVCDEDGVMRGVVTKSDIVRQIGHCLGGSCSTGVAEVMTRDVVCCEPGQTLDEVWHTMRQRRLRHVPVIDSEQRPLGVLYAHEALETLLKDAENEQDLLRDYVMGIGYR